MVLFRDALRDDPAKAEEYRRLKVALADTVGHNRLQYLDGKAAVVAGVVAEAEVRRMEKRYEMNSDLFRLDHVQLAMPASQEKVAREFYVDVLGFEEVPKPAELAKRGGAWFRSGSTNIHLGVDPEFVAAKKAHPALRCMEYDALLERLAAHAVSIQSDAIPFEGKRHCYIADPFGNRIELIEC